MRDILNRSFQGSVPTGSLRLINVLSFLATESKHTKSEESKKIQLKRRATVEPYKRATLGEMRGIRLIRVGWFVYFKQFLDWINC